MPLESTMLCLDNSEWMRNGDYAPTRLAAQQDAAVALANDRTNSNPENTVGVLTMAGHGVDMIASPTEEISRILAAFAKITIAGKTSVASSVQIAQLALKHRKNKNGGQRIIVFVGSPVMEETAVLVKIGKLLKKNNVAVDVVSMGDFEGNVEKLQEFVNAANSSEGNCHFMAVAPGVNPAEAILASPLVHMGTTFGSSVPSGDVVGSGTAGGNAFQEYGGVDPSLDPELAMALRVSMEEARSQQGAGAVDSTPVPGGIGATGTDAAVEGGVAEGEEDEETLMQQALALSMLDLEPVPSSSGAAAAADTTEGEAGSTPAGTAEEGSEGADDDEEAMRMALAMSVGDSAANSTVPTTSSSEGAAAENVDQEFISQLLGSVDVDMNDPLIQAALAQYQEGNEEQKGEAGKKRSHDGEDADKNKK